MKKILWSTLWMLPGLILAGYVFEGIEYDEAWILLVVALVLSLLNAVVRPLLILFALPFVLLTLGFGIFLINALLLYFAGALVPGFEVESFGVALLGSLLASVVNLFCQAMFGGSLKGKVTVRTSSPRGGGGSRRRPAAGRDLREDVIDV